MKFSGRMWLLIVVISSGMINNCLAQSRDSGHYKNPVNIPDTERIPPHRVVPKDSSVKKLEGGALIDTVTTKKRVRPQHDFNNRMDSLKKPNR